MLICYFVTFIFICDVRIKYLIYCVILGSILVVVVAELQQERWPLRSSSTVDDGLWQLWTLI